jgi:hypothetical protein
VRQWISWDGTNRYTSIIRHHLSDSQGAIGAFHAERCDSVTGLCGVGGGVDLGGEWRLTADNSADSKNPVGAFRWKWQNATAGAEMGRVTIRVARNGILEDYLYFDGLNNRLESLKTVIAPNVTVTTDLTTLNIKGSGTNITVDKPIVLPSDPTTNLQAATKQYVDANSGGGGSAIVSRNVCPFPDGFSELTAYAKPEVGKDECRCWYGTTPFKLNQFDTAAVGLRTGARCVTGVCGNTQCNANADCNGANTCNLAASPNRCNCATNADCHAGSVAKIAVYADSSPTNNKVFECNMDPEAQTIFACDNTLASSALNAGNYWVCVSCDDTLGDSCPWKLWGTAEEFTGGAVTTPGFTHSQICTSGVMPTSIDFTTAKQTYVTNSPLIVNPAILFVDQVEGTCGDGSIDPGESCDDGAANGSNRPCKTDCTIASCGDSLVCSFSDGVGGDPDCTTGPASGVEQCDDGNGSNLDGCLNTCANATCGDNFLCSDPGTCTHGPNPDGTEECDGTSDAACVGQCTGSCTCPAGADEYPTDWTSAFNAVWSCEEAAGLTVDNLEGNANNDLTDVNTVARDATNKKHLTQACHLNNNASEGRRLECAHTTCSELQFSSSYTIGAWVRPTAIPVGQSGNAQENHIFDSLTVSPADGLRMFRKETSGTSPQQMRCQIGTTGTPAIVSNITIANAWADDTWKHAVCVFNDTADTLLAYWDGKCHDTPTCTSSSVPGTMNPSTRPNFRIGGPGNGSLNARVDEMFAINKALTDQQICRIASVGIDGKLGTCADGDLTRYKSCNTNGDCLSGAVCETCADADCEAGTGKACVGRNNTEAQACDLPACNVVAP